MIGFVVPLYIICGLESLLGFWLMLPMPFCLPAVALCRFSKHNTVARTVINTTAAFLSILLLAPLYDNYTMHKAKENASHATPESLVETTGNEANSLLSASLTAAAICNLFMLRHLGACIDEREKLRVQLQDAGITPNEMQGTVNGSKPGQQQPQVQMQAQDIPLKAD
jgi:hypothetical protein